MIDINKMRRLAQAATPGGWYVKRGNYIYGCKEVTDGEEKWHPVIACTDDDEVNVNFEANAAFIAAANPAAISELLDRLEAAEKDIAIKEEVIDSLATVIKRLDAQCDDAEKEREIDEKRIADLMADLNRVGHENDALRAKIEQMEKQEPVAWMLNCPTLGGDTGWILSWTQSGAGLCNRLSGEENEKKLYALPGAKGE